MIDTNCGLQHNSCDGTDTFVRIARYYTESGTMAENVAQTAFSGVPEDAIRDWMNSAGYVFCFDLALADTRPIL